MHSHIPRRDFVLAVIAAMGIGCATMPVLALEPQPAVSQAAPSELEKSVAACTEMNQAHRLLMREYAAAKAQGSGFQGPLDASKVFVARWPECAEIHRLIGDCHRGLGNVDAAKASFLVYADMSGKLEYQKALKAGVAEAEAARRGNEAAAARLKGEGDRIFYEGKDYPGALSYFDDVGKTYPGTKAAERALLMTAEVYEKQRKPQEAIALCLKVIDTASDESIMIKAYDQAAHLYINTQDKPGAISLTREKEKKVTTEKAKARAAFEIGVLYYDSGKRFWSDAQLEFQRVMDTYPNDECAAHAKRMIGTIKAELQGK